MMRQSAFGFFALMIFATCTALPAFCEDIRVSGDWVRLGDVAPVTGKAADKLIAASPLPGQRLPLTSAFINMQAAAAGYPVAMPDGQTIWVVRSDQPDTRTLPAIASKVITETAETMPDDLDGQVPVLNMDVRRGDPITADMVDFETPDPKRRIQGLIRSAVYLEDTEATRTIRAGQMLSMRDVQPVSVIRKGDPVQLVYQAGALRLTVSATALENAARGDSIRVMNLQSKRTMDAVASAPGEARVGSAGL